MNINFDKLKKFKQLPKKIVLMGSIATILLNPFTSVDASANENNNSYYEYLEDEDTLSISSVDDLNQITNSFNLQHLKTLKIDSCNFENLQFLSKCCNLQSLYFNNCNIKELKGIEILSDLNTLYFYNVGIESINELSSLKNLTELTLCCTQISDLSPISNLKLTYLDIWDSTNIKNLDPITNIDTLETLIAYNCEMAYTENLINYTYEQQLETNITDEGLIIKNQVKKIADEIIDNNMSSKEKIDTIVNYVINNIEYDYEAEFNEDLCNEYNDNALKYALEGIGCCRNYTALTTALFNECGIKTYDVKGNGHIWNLVKLGNDFYWIDSTWMDLESLKDINNSDYYMNELDDPDFVYSHSHSSLPSSAYFTQKTNNDVPTYEEEFDKVSNVTQEDEVLTMIEENHVSNIIEENETTNTNNVSDIAKNQIINKVLPAGAIVGIALACGAAIKFNIKKKQKDINKTK